MKRAFAVVLAVCFLLLSASMAWAVQPSVSVYIDGEELVSETPAVLEKGTTFLPLRAVFEALGQAVAWDGTQNRVDIATGVEAAAPQQNALTAAALAYFAGIAQGNNNIVDSNDLYEMLQADADSVYILDIRGAADFADYHIQNSVNCAWGEVGALLNVLPHDKTIAVGCYTGQSAGQTVGVLRMAGFDAVSIKGGITNGWYAAELPVVQ